MVPPKFRMSVGFLLVDVESDGDEKFFFFGSSSLEVKSSRVVARRTGDVDGAKGSDESARFG